MTFGQFQDYLIEFGDVSLRVNRPRTRRAIECAVLEWYEPPANVPLKEYRASYVERVKACYRERYGVGFVEWMLLIAIGQVIAFVVRRLLEWYFDRPTERAAVLWKFRAELERGL